MLGYRFHQYVHFGKKRFRQKLFGDYEEKNIKISWRMEKKGLTIHIVYIIISRNESKRNDNWV